MREHVPFPVNTSDDKEWDEFANSGDVGIVDCREDPYEALISIDKILKTFGLEVIMYDSGSSDYWFTVVKIEENNYEDS